ncbi:MAG: hypothetical protein CSA29_05395 [Desulfobacterales bacterium]|nr:MAG: hypothetical protein CSA29_05395 [Desulfobacterales bacterium]
MFFIPAALQRKILSWQFETFKNDQRANMFGWIHWKSIGRNGLNRYADMIQLWIYLGVSGMVPLLSCANIDLEVLL